MRPLSFRFGRRGVTPVAMVLALGLMLGLGAGTGLAASWFLALDLPEDVQQSLVSRQSMISQSLPADTTVVWHPAANLHITLQGISNTLSSTQLAMLSQAMQQVSVAAKRFSLTEAVTNADYEVWDGAIVFKLKPSRSLREFSDAIYNAVKNVLPHEARIKCFYVSLGVYTREGDRAVLKGLSVSAPACAAFPVTSFVLRQSNEPQLPRRSDVMERYAFRNKAMVSCRDYDADGCSDLAVYGPNAGQWLLKMVADLDTVYGIQWSSTNSTFVTGSAHPPSLAALEAGAGSGLMPFTGLFDADGRSDPGMYDEVSGTWTILYSTENFTAHVFVLGGPGYVAVPGDYDADGLTDPAVYNAAEGYWKFLLSDSQYSMDEGYLGGPVFTAVPDDYDGDGEIDLAVYAEATGTWKALFSGSEYAVDTNAWGGPGWTPVVGDYDGDGVADPAVYETTTGSWQTLFSGSSYQVAAGVLGGLGWYPTP